MSTDLNAIDDKLSVIIPTYNRYDKLQNAIESVKNQTYKNIEIIIVNDNSFDGRYYEKSFLSRKDIKIINLNPCTKTLFDFSMIPNGINRNIGLQFATGTYIAFLDDDDYWMPQKIELQLNEMKQKNIQMSCTEGFIGNGVYNFEKKYKLYHGEYFRDFIVNKFNCFIPNIMTKGFLSIHNCCITSSVVIKHDLLKKEQFKPLNNAEDYDLWLRILDYTDCLFLNIPLMYYDSRHTNHP